MSSAQVFDDEPIASGLTGAEVQETARRQLVASIAVAVVILIGAGLAALTPASPRRDAEAAPHRLASVQQPTFATPPAQRVASVRPHEIELP
ncbi:MAG: hypothetical protein ACLQE9_01140 [Roseiarcus sp.]